MSLVEFRGPSAGFSHRERLLLAQRALSVSGVALTGRGSRSPRHVSCARAERRPLGYASRDDLSTSRREPPPIAIWICLPDPRRRRRECEGRGCRPSPGLRAEAGLHPLCIGARACQSSGCGCWWATLEPARHKRGALHTCLLSLLRDNSELLSD